MATQLKIFSVPANGVLNIEGGRFLVNTSAGPVNIYLPPGAATGASFIVYDASRNSATNNITIRSMIGELINGAATLVLNGNGDSADIFSDGNGGWIATVSGTSGGGGGGSQIYTGAAPPAAPADPTKAAIFYPTGGGTEQQWNVAGASWV